MVKDGQVRMLMRLMNREKTLETPLCLLMMAGTSLSSASIARQSNHMQVRGRARRSCMI